MTVLPLDYMSTKNVEKRMKEFDMVNVALIQENIMPVSNQCYKKKKRHLPVTNEKLISQTKRICANELKETATLQTAYHFFPDKQFYFLRL